MGPYAQTKIKGNDVSYYTDAMNEARSKILAEFKKNNESLLSGETKNRI